MKSRSEIKNQIMKNILIDSFSCFCISNKIKIRNKYKYDKIKTY